MTRIAAFLLAFASLVGPSYAQGVTRLSPEFIARILSSHNVERSAVGVAPMRWNAKLADDAQLWADHLALTSTFEHSPEPPKGQEVGENLWMGTIHAYSFEEMVGGWIAERKDFINGVFPNVSRTGNWDDVGHYTQLIWAETREVGCAVADNGEDEFLVCRYAKAGNWFGQPVLATGTPQFAHNASAQYPKLSVSLPD